MEFNTKEFQEYSQFENVETMDEVIYEYKAILEADQVATSVIELLLYLGRSSLMIPGVSWKKQSTIANDLGYDVKTIRNGLNKLMEYGMIHKERTTSKWVTPTGGAKRRQGVNVISIRAYIPSNITYQDSPSTEFDKVNEDKALSDENKKEPSSFKQSFLKDYYVLDATIEEARNRNNVPKPLYEALSPFFYGKELRKYVGIIFRAKTSKLRIEAYADEFKACIIDCIRRVKSGSVNNLESYMYKSIRNLSRSLYVATRV